MDLARDLLVILFPNPHAAFGWLLVAVLVGGPIVVNGIAFLRARKRNRALQRSLFLTSD